MYGKYEYVRTDRNGTKIYNDWECPRCGGAGRSDNWWRTGFTCHKCGGTGKRSAPRIVKEYTDEYAAKLDARRAAKAAAAVTVVDEAEQAARVAEWMRNKYAQHGFSADGVSYVYQGNTYKFRNDFRNAGAVWAYSRWFSPVPVECGIAAQVVSADGYYQDGCLRVPDIIFDQL